MDHDTAPESPAETHPGSCHCGAVKFQVDIDVAKASRCNCTICTKMGVTGGIVKPDAFRLLEGEGSLSTYGKSEVAKRYFCKQCGIHCFGKGHLEQLGGDFVSVNINCLDDVDLATLHPIHWDGRHNNWQAGPRDTPWPI